ncbi:hypothetical protein E3N88_42768 [Mikania micrantha]|uniref:Uncharacterized protein n=1 Tax=Mikania micrantha TaxID=192012 RepID=A0A5N6LGU5_9ASTR|nr:hypothetical protein E3N88_42768 [Mikania micrantha]
MILLDFLGARYHGSDLDRVQSKALDNMEMLKISMKVAMPTCEALVEMEAARQEPMRKFQEAAEQEDQPPEMRLCEEMKVEMKKPLNWFVAEEAVRMEK